jgi:hypothetical protein
MTKEEWKEMQELLAELKKDSDYNAIYPMPQIIVQMGNGTIIVTAAQDTKVIANDANGIYTYVAPKDRTKYERVHAQLVEHATYVVESLKPQG